MPSDLEVGGIGAESLSKFLPITPFSTGTHKSDLMVLVRWKGEKRWVTYIHS